jgi:hypothetical protein
MLMAVSVSGCSSSTRPSHGTLDTLVKSKLGSRYTIQHNESKQYALCQQKTSDTDHAYRSFKFIVVKLSDNTIAAEGSFKNGYVKWIDGESIEVSSSGADEKRLTKVLKINGQQS